MNFRFLAIGAIVALSALSAGAQTLTLAAGNIGDGSGIQVGAGATFTGNPSPFPFTSRQAMPFTLASTALLGAVEVTIANLNGGGGVTVSLAPDLSGRPNDALAITLGTIDTSVFFADAYDRLSVPLASFPQLDGGQTYWIVLNGAANSVYVWNRAGSGPTGSFNADETGWQPNSFSYGYNVYVTAIPEPATVVGGLVAMGVVVARLRRRK